MSEGTRIGSELSFPRQHRTTAALALDRSVPAPDISRGPFPEFSMRKIKKRSLDLPFSKSSRCECPHLP